MSIEKVIFIALLLIITSSVIAGHMIGLKNGIPPQDSMYWEIDCRKAGNYIVEMEYLCKKEDAGSKIICSIGNENLTATIQQPFYSGQIPSPDRVPRKEAYGMKEWKILQIGSFHISWGKHIVKLKALKTEHENVAEVNGLWLNFINH